MSIYCGNSSVSKIYAGNTQITKAYLGNSIVLNGSTPPPSTTELLLHFDGNLTDSSSNNYTLTPDGISYDSTNKVFGASSLYTGSYSNRVTLNSTSEYNSLIGSMSGNFTIEFWFRLTDEYDLPNMFWFYDYDTYSQIRIYTGYGDIYAEMNDATNYYSINSNDVSVVLNSFNHLAFIRNGSNIYLYLNGSLKASQAIATVTLNSSATAHNFFMGELNGGNIDEFRISSAAMYSGSSFTVPSSPLS